MKTNKKAIAYLALAYDTMKLLRSVTKARSEDWPEGEAWKVMQSLTKKYRPNVLKVKVELRKMPGNEEKQNLNEEEVLETTYKETNNEEVAKEDLREVAEFKDESNKEVNVLSEQDVAKEDLNVEEENEEEVNKEETILLIDLDVLNENLNEEEELDVRAEDANKGKETVPKLVVGKWTLVVKQPEKVVKAIKKKAIKKKNKGKPTLVVKPLGRVGEWTIVVKQPGRALKATKKKAAKKKKDKKKKKKKHKNKKCVRVQSYNGRVSEVSCENCTHTAIVAHKFGYVQREISGIDLHHESWWDCIGLHHESWWDCIGLHYQSCWDCIGLHYQSCWDCIGIESWWDYKEK